jgi:hypothetical protein
MSLRSIGAASATPLPVPATPLQKKEETSGILSAFNPDSGTQSASSSSTNVQPDSAGTSSSQGESLPTSESDANVVTVQQSLDTQSLVGVTTYDAQGKLHSQPPSAGRAVSFSA